MTYLQRLWQESSGPAALYVEFGGHSTGLHFNFPAATKTDKNAKRRIADLISTTLPERMTGWLSQVLWNENNNCVDKNNWFMQISETKGVFRSSMYVKEQILPISRTSFVFSKFPCLQFQLKNAKPLQFQLKNAKLFFVSIQG